ncbi:ferric iron reductase [Ancylobacter sp. SL191]|uniref:ferric iron reductase n=1 Tax=Ancylobacter sp. SL191 TaxID=2995166 RepID=UPI00226D7F48|nr:ferric iron reductase [Ancylobacter sp. SL191]WAC26642.1 ferric iron reductase [Ancylobacter sp. SL191]
MNAPPNGADKTTEAARIISAAFGVLARHWTLPQADVGPVEPGFTPLTALFGAEPFLAAMLARQQAGTPGLDAKGAAAFFISEYSNLLGILAAVPFLSHGLVPDLSAANCALSAQLPPGEAPRVRLRLLNAAGVTDRVPAEAEACFSLVDHEGLRDALSHALEAHMAPLIDSLHARTDLPRRAMWRLVGDAVAMRFLEAGQRLGCEATAKEDVMAVLMRPGSPLANRQLHFFDVEIVDDAPPREVLARRTFRARGGCCRFYTAPGGSLCTSCVLVKPEDRRQRIEARMRAELGLPPAPQESFSPLTPASRHQGGDA